MKKRGFAVAIVSAAIFSAIKFVETDNLKKSGIFGAAHVYTDNKSFVNNSSGNNVSESKWYGEFNQVIGEAMVAAVSILTNNQVAATALTAPILNAAVAYIAVIGDSEKAEHNINHNQNIAMADLD